jgi:hypothetical protein
LNKPIFTSSPLERVGMKINKKDYFFYQTQILNNPFITPSPLERVGVRINKKEYFVFVFGIIKQKAERFTT